MNNAVGYISYQLKELMKDHSLASVFTDPNNPDDFIAGYVRMVGARTTLVSAVTPYGRADGFFAIRLMSVLEVQFDSLYAERLELLMRLDNEKAAPFEISSDDDAIVALLGWAVEYVRAVTLWTATETFSGFVKQVNDLYVTLEPVDFMGGRCPEMTFRLTDIEMVSAGSEEERMYERLDDYHHEKRGGR